MGVQESMAVQLVRCDGCGKQRVYDVEQAADGRRHIQLFASAMRDGWGWNSAVDRFLCPKCKPREGGPRGFTLVEVLAVVAIVAIVAAASLPFALNWSRSRAVHSAAEGLQAAIVGAREGAARDRAARGLRIVPDATLGVPRGPGGRVDGSKALAGGRVVPMEAGPGYAAGLASIDVGPLPAGFAKPAAVLMAEQSKVDREGSLVEGTAWAWNARVGDRIRIGGVEADYWVVGPDVAGPAANPERFVNYGPDGPDLDRGDGQGRREYLWLVNGLDDDGDGLVDPGFDGVDHDLDGVIDGPGEWIEEDLWREAHRRGARAEPYRLLRRPVPSAGPAVEMGAAAVDLTGWGLAPPPRSRAMVDPWTGCVELVVQPDGRIRPAIVASSPASLGLRGDWIHLWIADRSDVLDSPRPGGEARLVSIQGRTGRVVVTEIDPDDPTAAFDAAEGR